MKKNPTILFFTHYFPPEVNAPPNRTYEHEIEWIKKGAKVIIVTNNPNHPDGILFTGYKNKFQTENLNGIEIRRMLTFITPNERFVLRTLNYLIYMVFAFFYSLLFIRKPDVMIATTPQFFCASAGKYYAKIKRSKFILELRDLWPESIVAVGALKNKTIINILEKIELNLYKSADLIISVTQSFKENLIKRGINPNKIEIIYNGVYFDSFTNGKAINDKELEDYLKDAFKVGYIGTIGMAHSISTLVKAAETLENSDVKFVIVGSGAERENIQNLIDEKKLKNIKIFSLRPKEEIPFIISKLDIFLVHLKKNDLFKTVIPSKIFEGMFMKKAILIGVDGEARTIIEDAKAGEFFEPENAIELCEAVNRLKNNRNKMNIYGDNGYNYVIENFDRKKSAEKFLSLIDKVVNQN